MVRMQWGPTGFVFTVENMHKSELTGFGRVPVHKGPHLHQINQPFSAWAWTPPRIGKVGNLKKLPSELRPCNW